MSPHMCRKAIVSVRVQEVYACFHSGLEFRTQVTANGDHIGIFGRFGHFTDMNPDSCADKRCLYGRANVLCLWALLIAGASAPPMSMMHSVYFPTLFDRGWAGSTPE